MSEEKWWEKDFFTEERKEKSKKAGKASAFGGIGLILFAFFLGYCFLAGDDPASITVRIEAGYAFAIYVFLGFAAGFCGLFIGVYWIFHLGEWFLKAQELAGISINHPLMWWGFYPAAFIGCLINFLIMVAIVFFIVRAIIRKIRK